MTAVTGPRRRWEDDALCQQVDTEVFFPERGGGTTHAAKQVCKLCDVQPECLEHALAADEEYGVWGGMSERQRRKINHPGATPATPHLTPGQVAEMCAAYQAGATAWRLADAYGVAHTTVIRRLREAGVVVRPQHGRENTAMAP